MSPSRWVCGQDNYQPIIFCNHGSPIPANNSRSLQDLAQETTRVANQYVAGLMTAGARERRKRYDPWAVVICLDAPLV